MKQGKKQKILIVEDSQTQAEMLRYILEEKDYIVDHRLDGEQAMEFIRDDRPDFIISDVIMPAMNGYELCKKIKSDPELCDIPVLLLTTLTDAEDILIGLECGADTYLMKPYDEKLLLGRLHAMLNRDTPLTDKQGEKSYPLFYDGKKYELKTTRTKILNMMISTYEAARQKNNKLQQTQHELSSLKISLEKRVEERTVDLMEKIRERREIESSVMESEKKYRGIVENALFGVFTTDTDGTIRFVNDAMVKLLEFESKKEIIGKPLKQIAGSKTEFEEVMKKVRAEKQLYNHEFKMLGNKQAKKHVIMNLVLRENNLSGVLFDITEKKALEENDKQYREKLKIAKEKAEESDRQKSEFLSNMSHEIKTPLNTIVGFSSLLKDVNQAEGQRREYLNHIDQNSMVLSGLVNNVLELARLEASKIQLSEKHFRINNLMDEIYAEFTQKESVLTGRKVAIELFKDNADPEFLIMGDEMRLKQVLHNLLDNASRFTKEGFIRIGYEIKDEKLQFFVKDTGSGIRDEMKDVVFERFQKVEERQGGQNSGLGIGLTISHQLVEMMQGKIWLQSEGEKGTEVYFTIPLREIDMAEVKPSKPDVKSKDGDLTGSHFLVVEDNEMNYTLLKAYLDNTGVKISWAKDGLEAVDYFSKGNEFDLVLMDLHMPNMDGFQATEAIRKMNPEIPIIAVTAYTMAEEHDLARIAGFSDFLTKPVGQDRLIETVSKFVPETRAITND